MTKIKNSFIQGYFFNFNKSAEMADYGHDHISAPYRVLVEKPADALASAENIILDKKDEAVGGVKDYVNRVKDVLGHVELRPWKWGQVYNSKGEPVDYGSHVRTQTYLDRALDRNEKLVKHNTFLDTLLSGVQKGVRGTSKLSEKHPGLEMASLAGIGAAVGKFGSQFVLNKLVGSLLLNVPPERRAAELQKLHADGTINKISNVLGIAGALAGAGFSGAKHIDFRSLGNAAKSLTVPGYKDKNRDYYNERLQRSKDFYREKYLNNIKDTTPQFDDGRSQKNASYSSVDSLALSRDTIPISHALDTFKADPFLTVSQKEIASYVIQGAEDSTSGLTNGNSVIRSAVAAGAGAVAGHMFGKVTSSIFSLPPIVTKRLSNTGAIAGALIGTGLFTEFGE